MQKNQALPITHPINVARLPQKGMAVKLIANEKERTALAKDHALVSVDSFEAELLVSKWRRDGVKITGKVKADIVQTCSITLEALLASIENEIEAVFVPETSKLAKPKFDADGEMVLDANGPDAPETFSGDTLDVGLIAEEFFELAIDPYPRKEGAELEVNDTGADKEQAKVSPFAKLASLKQKQ